MRLYLCGPMTGIKQYNFPKFMDEAKRLRDAGYEVLNPAELAMEYGFDPIKNPEIVCSDEMRRAFLERDKEILLTCDGVAMMDGWSRSPGCNEEFRHFVHSGKQGGVAHHVEYWIMNAISLRNHISKISDPITRSLSMRREEVIGEFSHPDAAPVPPPIRSFSTGATRDADSYKLDFDGFLCPLVLERYAKYMHANRKMPDGSMRGSDNWKKGIPQDVYRKSAWRYFFGFWKHCLRGEKELAIVDACGILFNVMGWMHEELKHEDNSKA